MAQPNFDFGAILQKSWQIYLKNVATFIVSLIIFCVVIVATAFIARLILGRLAGIALPVVQGPLMVGFCGIALSAARGGSPQIPNLFDGFKRFLPAFLTALIIGIPSIIATAAGNSLINIVMTLASLAFIFLFFLSYYFLSDKKMDVVPALLSSQKTVMEGIGPWVILFIIVFAMNFVGAIPCGIGLLVTVPLSLTALALAYDQVTGGGYSISEAPAHEDYQA